MREYLLRLVDSTKELSIEAIILNVIVAVAIGVIIYISYWITHMGSVYSKKFNVSLIMLTVLTATVMIVIGNNVALSLGMVGALSIVRYRTAIKDSRDTAYIFWAVIGGICCGSANYLIAGVGTAAVFLVLLLLGRIKNDNRMLLIIRGTLKLEREIESVVFLQFDKKAKLRVKNTTAETIELIYEVSERMYSKANATPKSLVNSIYALGEISYVNVVTQNDEIV